MHARRSALAALFAAALIAASANAATVKVGFVAVFTGPEALTGEQLYKGFELYLKTHPNVPGGHKIEVLKRDTAGPAPDRAKRLTQELIARDKVDLVTGIMFSSEGFAMMDVCREAKFPMLILIAGANGMTDACPYAVRVSFGMWQAGYPMGEYAFQKMGVKTAAIAYANYAPGKDSSGAFRSGFERAGGKIIADVPLPFPNLPDFTPFLQRIKDLKPDAVYVFIPAGKWATGVMKTYNDLGMREAGIKLIGPGDITTDSELPNMGDVPVGVVTVHHYSAAATRPENVAFVKAWKAAYGPDSTPDFISVGAWDGAAALYHVIEQTNGKITTESFLKALQGWKSDQSPRGPIMIDPQTRDIVDNQYVRRVEKKDGKLVNVEIDTIPMVKDPWRQFGQKPSQ
jgi:branched-chain amino acid transport system substrate-binding protein